MTINNKLFEGQGHIFKRINLRCDRIESQIEELSRRLEESISDVKTCIDDMLEHLRDNE